MSISDITTKIIEFSNGNIHDINHLLKVWAFAKTIAESEKTDNKLQEVIEVAALIHDIACPLCREKYGNTNGKNQELEGGILARKFLSNTNYSKDFIERVVYLVEHHHTFTNIGSIDYQILIEADYIVNAYESNYSKENIENFSKKFFKTTSGLNLLKSIYKI